MLVLCSDFAENRRNEHQNQPSSAHWTYTQSTLHPIKCNYRCPQSECTETVTEKLIFITDRNKHDPHAVNAFEDKVVELVQEKVSVKRVVKYSDGCVAQYKSKRPYYLMSKQTKWKEERNYFGSNYGKSLCD